VRVHQVNKPTRYHCEMCGLSWDVRENGVVYHDIEVGISILPIELSLCSACLLKEMEQYETLYTQM